MPLRARPELDDISECPHGGINTAELATAGLNPKAVIDFSVCTNPYMPPLGMKNIIKTVDFRQYPDSAATELKQKLSSKLGEMNREK